MNTIVQAAMVATFVALGAQYTVIDAQGHVVGTLVTDAPAPSQMRVIGVTNAGHSAPVRADRQADRTFHPDYSKALTADQMMQTWRDESDRISPPVITGGG